MKVKKENQKKKKKKDELTIYLLMMNLYTCVLEFKNENDKSHVRKYIKKNLKILRTEREEMQDLEPL